MEIPNKRDLTYILDQVKRALSEVRSHRNAVKQGDLVAGGRQTDYLRRTFVFLRAPYCTVQFETTPLLGIVYEDARDLTKPIFPDQPTSNRCSGGAQLDHEPLPLFLALTRIWYSILIARPMVLLVGPLTIDK